MEKLTPNLFYLNSLLKRRWSPTIFDDRPLSPEHLGSLFEAARWSASCFNEQPWNFVVAARHSQPEAFHAFVSCLDPGNALWAQHAPLLMFSVAQLNFNKTGKVNPYAFYDSGQALAHLSIQAVELNIFVHQMAGFDRAKAKDTTKVPGTHEVVCAIAMGYGVLESAVPAAALPKETSPRIRKLVGEFLHEGRF